MEQLCCLDYLYRDASNSKQYGSLLLKGEPSDAACKAITASLSADEFFIAEQVLLPPLYFRSSEDSLESCECDHVWHEFIGLRLAEGSEADQPIFATLDDIINRFQSVVTWQEALSSNWPEINPCH